MWSILLDIGVLLAPLGAGAAAEDARPVDGVVVAQHFVPRDVDVAVVDSAQRSQPQGGERWNLHHQQRVTPENARDRVIE